MRISQRERKATDLTRAHRVFLLVLVSIGSSIIYTPAYLKDVFYKQLMAGLDASNAQLGQLLSAYAITATICYLPSGFIADRVRVRTLSWVGFVTTGALTLVYAMRPSMTMLMLVFVGMGVTSILIWWGVRYKLVRLISTEAEYPRNIGLSYGLYGLAGLVVGFINSWIIRMVSSSMGAGVTALLIFLAGLIFLLGILSFFFIPKFEGEIGGGDGGSMLKDSFRALQNPVVWLAAASMFCVYFFYKGISYTTPYLSDVFGASQGMVDNISLVRTYGITLLSGPVFGWMAARVKSSALTIVGGSVFALVGLIAFAILPGRASLLVIAAIVAVLMGFVANGVFGIVSSQLTEGKVPTSIFGAAAGVVSVVGFLPDSFQSTWFGTMIDNNGNDAYRGIFIICAVVAGMSIVVSMILRIYVRKNNSKLEALEEAELRRAVKGH